MKRLARRWSQLKWLRPGMGVKRWLFLLMAGLPLLSLGLLGVMVALQMVELARPDVGLAILLSTSALTTPLFLVAGAGLVAAGIGGLNRSLLSAFRRRGEGEIVDVVYRHRQRQRGPRVVAIGGGHGLNTLLRGLKEYTDNITAIVTVADDGGSSGRLRRELGVLPPGDFRNCIAALSDAEGLMTALLQYRFGNDSDLEGHTFGNLYLTAMAAITGSFEAALSETSRVLAVRGRVVPSTLAQVNLCAEVGAREPGAPVGAAPADPAAGVAAASRWLRVCGESRIGAIGTRIQRVYLDPGDVPAYPEAIRAILEAELIVAGPGSLFTSVLPNLLVPDLAQAVAASQAARVYVCNVATQTGETDGFDVDDHMRALRRHVGPDLFTTVLANDAFPSTLTPGGGAEFVRLPSERPGAARTPLEGPPDYHLVTAELIDEKYPWRHDPTRLAQALMGFVNG